MDPEAKAREAFSRLTPIQNKIKLLLHATYIDIFQIQKIQGEIDMFETDTKNPNVNYKTYEDFMNNYAIDMIELVDTSFYSNLCQNCNEVCHENCESDEITVIGDQVLQQCWMIKDGNCRQCIGKCSYMSHYRAEKIIKRNKKKIQDILSDILIKYDQTSHGKPAHRKTIIPKEDASKILENALNQKSEETKQLCVKLDQICASSDLTQELRIFIDHLNKECISLKSVQIRKQGTALIRSLENFFHRLANESDLTIKTFTYNTNGDPKNSNKAAKDMKPSPQAKKAGETQQPGIDDNELKELLIDELLQNQKASNLKKLSEVQVPSTRFALIQNKMKMLLHATRTDIFQIQKVQDEMDIFETKPKASSTDYKTYADFMNNHMIDTMELVDVSFYSTLCQNCNEVCHENCENDEITTIGDQVLQQCWMIKNGNCRQCIGKCSYMSHYRAEKIIKRNKKKIQDILSDILIKYDQTSEGKPAHRKTTVSKEDASKTLERALKENIHGITKLCTKLFQICPGYEVTHELQVFIDQLDRESIVLSGPTAKKRTNVLISSLKDLCNVILADSRLVKEHLLQMTIDHTEHEEKTNDDAKLSEMTKKIHKTQESTTAKRNTMGHIAMPELAASEKSRDSVASAEIEDVMTTSKQEILDTSGMAKILIIGETGSGKSTFVNYLTNYFYNGTLQKLRIAIPSKFHPCVTEKFIHCENDIQNTTHSKTDNCNQYMFFSDLKQYLFVDTPGLSDTRGMQQDDENVAKIIDSVESLGGLSAVIIVVNGAVSRLTINLRNVLTRLRGNLPDVIMDNVIIVLTNVTRYASNFSINALELNGNVYPYYMQNSAFSQDPATWTSAIIEAIQYDFDRSMNEIRNMIKTIDTFQTKSVIAFKTMKDIRSDIKTLFHKAHLEVAQIQKLQDEINIFEGLIKQCDTELVTYKDYTEEREIEVIEVVDASVNSTLCGQCNQVCHENCQLNETTTLAAQISSQCWIFKDGSCRRCVDKCSHTAHYYAKKTIKKSKKKIQTILNNIKLKYDQTADEKNTYQKNITSKEDARRILELVLKEKTEEIKQLCLKLRHICAGFDHTQELNIFISQLETEETMLKSIEAKQQTRVLIRVLKDLCSRMANDPELSAKTLAKMNIVNTEPSSDSQANRIYKNSTEKQSSNNHPSTSQQNSDATISKPPSELDCHANDDVLAVIRAINKKKMAKDTSKHKPNKTAQSKTKANRNCNDNVSSTESSNDGNESEGDEKRRSASQKDTHVSQSTVMGTRDPRTLSTDELIACYSSQKGHPEANLIIFELVQRSLGKSTGPMSTPEAVADFAASTRKYSVLGANELAKEYEILKHRINDITGSDIFKIHQVPSNVLSEIAAVHMLLQSSSSIQNSSFHTSTDQIQQPIEMSPSYLTNRTSSSQRIHGNALTGNSQSHPQNSLNSSDASIKPNNQSCVRPNIVSRSIRQPILDSSLNSNKTLESTQQPNIPTNVLKKSLRATNRHSTASNTDSSEKSSLRRSPSEFTASDTKLNDLEKMPTVRLISNYRDGCARGNNGQTNPYYSELKRRCYGNYPTLISEKRALFDELCRTYQNRTLKELKENQLRIHEKIDLYLTDGSPALINEIPKELIVEAAALNHLISKKTSEVQ